MRFQIDERIGRETGSERHHLGAGLPEVVRERVHERVLMIHEHDAPAGPGA